MAKAAVAAKKRPAVAERSDQVQSLVRALSLINRIASANEGLTLTELAQQVGLSASTAHRLLTTLEQERYVHFDPERRLWSVGVQAFVTGSAFLKTRSLVGAARLHMRALMEESEETVNLAVEDEAEAIYLSQVECRQMMRAFARPGGRVLLHCSSVGKALMSAMPDAKLSKVLHRHGLPRITIKTLNTTAALKADLEATRERGYAIDDEEHAVGLRCIAAVISTKMPSRSPQCRCRVRWRASPMSGSRCWGNSSAARPTQSRPNSAGRCRTGEPTEPGGTPQCVSPA